MASPGRLSVLLMSLLLISAVIGSPSGNQEKSNKAKKIGKETGTFVLGNMNEIRQAVTPCLSLIEPDGSIISAVVNVILLGVQIVNPNSRDDPTLKYLKFQFDDLNVKLDKYHEEQKWASWAAGAFHKPEKDIEVAWTTFTTFVNSLVESKDVDEKNRHIAEFIEDYQKYKDATKTLHVYLKTNPISFVENLPKALANYAKCHEQDIRDYTALINELIYKGNTMNQVYYKIKNVKSQAKIDEAANIAYKAASAMFQVHKYCIENSIDFIKQDVMGLIDNTQHREELAQKVRSFLTETYGRYDWIVVAFLTKNSQHYILKTLNKHVLTGFTEVTKGEVSVAVAKQVKGTHTKAADVRQAIETCLDKSVMCKNVAEKLRECKKSVRNIPVSDIYTAVHAYRGKAHDGQEAQDIQDEIQEVPAYGDTPYIYTGECVKDPGVKFNLGKFVVLIKSDEEMMNTDPCSKLKCGEDEHRGNCVPVEKVLAMCVCKYPYYGQNCENSLDDYKKALDEEIDTNSDEFKKAWEKPELQVTHL